MHSQSSIPVPCTTERLRSAVRQYTFRFMASPDKKSFALRVDPVLWTEIERLAAAELRSVNAQVEYLLREAVRARWKKIAKPKPSNDPSG